MTEQHFAGTIGILGAGWLGLPLCGLCWRQASQWR